MAFKPLSENKLSKLPKNALESLRQAKSSAGTFSRTLLRNPLKPKERFEPTWYQEEFFNCKKRFVLINAGRQVGKSEMAVKFAVYTAFTTPRSKILFVSASQRQASFLIHKVRQDIEESEILSKSIVRSSRTEVHLDNGSYIVSLPPSEATIRGYTADIVLIDEAAHIPHGEDLFYEVIMPMVIRTGGRIILTSTPYGQSGFFYEMYVNWSKDTERAKVFHFPALKDGKPLAPGVDIRDLENQREAMGPTRFAVEYLAEFVDEGTLYFPTSLINSVVEEYELKRHGMGDKQYFMGIDWGKQKSATVITIIEKNPMGASKVVLMKEYRLPYDQVIQQVAYFAERFNIRKCLADTGAGLAQIDQLKAMGLRIEGFNFTVQSKIDMFGHLRLLMENKEIVLPYIDKLKGQLLSFRQTKSKTGKILLHAESGAHDDYVDSLALAAYSLRKSTSSTQMRKVSKKNPKFLSFF